MGLDGKKYGFEKYIEGRLIISRKRNNISFKWLLLSDFIHMKNTEELWII